MKKFIFSDLHIGHKDTKYSVIREAINHVRSTAEEGDEIWGLGDWFHMAEEGVDTCRSHVITEELITLAGEIPIKLVTGNHDYELECHSELFIPIQIVKPFEEDGFYHFEENGIWYGHGQQFDPACKYVHRRLRKWMARLTGKKTPGVLKGEKPTWNYLQAVNIVHSQAILELQDKDYKGIVLGHTHFPLLRPEIPFLINGGDMMDSLTFTVQDDHGFHLMQWNGSRWQEISHLKIY